MREWVEEAKQLIAAKLAAGGIIQNYRYDLIGMRNIVRIEFVKHLWVAGREESFIILENLTSEELAYIERAVIGG